MYFLKNKNTFAIVKYLFLYKKNSTPSFLFVEGERRYINPRHKIWKSYYARVIYREVLLVKEITTN
jgi:hypothetical protein